MLSPRIKTSTREITVFLKELSKKNLSHEEYEEILKVFLTPAELDAIAQRLQIVNLIIKGVTQREISEKLGVGVATVTRGSRMLQENEHILQLVFPRNEQLPI
ncbi:Trp family transcriptional regulator [Spirobacillus cienkowskii]|jgi:TrpR family trp operon transcriptional repressor|uniref:Trp family transcriptional regulator n=1 Tax=Spirobacillus cienkowskii TaxID=495820 RepID=UPI0030D1F74C